MSIASFGEKNFLHLIVDALVENYKNKARQKFRFPAKISAAKIHMNAARFGYKPRIKKDSEEVRCACCNLTIGHQQVPFCYPTTTVPHQQGNQSQQFRLKYAVSLFFYFIKMIIIFLIVKFLLTDAYNIFTSISSGNYCQRNKHQCHMSIWTVTSGLNKKQHNQLELQVLDILNFIFIIVCIPFFIIFRQIIYRHVGHLDSHQQSQEDYAIFVEGIPVMEQKITTGNIPISTQIDSQNQIQQFFCSIIKNWLENYDNFPRLEAIQRHYHETTSIKGKSDEIIKSISLCYDLTQLDRIKILRKKIMKLHEEAMVNAEQLSECQQIKTLNAAQLELSKQFVQQKDLVFNLTHFVGCAVVCFQYEHYKQLILRKAKKQSIIFKGASLYISQAPGPRDIHWFNLAISQTQKIVRVGMSIFFMILCLLFSFVLVGLIQMQKYKFNQYFQIDSDDVTFSFKNYKGIIIYCLTFLASCITLSINYGLYYLLIYLTETQFHKTRTRQYSYLIVKLLFSQFLNYAIIYPLIYLFLPYENLTDLGLVFTVSTLIAFSAVVQVILNLLNLPDLYRRLVLRWKYRNVKDDDPLPYFQVNLNRQLEYVQFDLVSRYTFYILQIYTIMLYSYAIPLGSIISIVALFFHYWIDKYNLFTRSSLKYNFGLFITKYLLKFFQFSLFIFAVGNIYFSYYTKNQWTILNLIGALIAALYCLIFGWGYTNWEQRIIQKYYQCNQYTYTECANEGKFRNTFWLSNPATQLVQEQSITGHRNTSKQIKQQFFSAILTPNLMKQMNEILQQELV